jgi:hypothetical protein
VGDQEAGPTDVAELTRLLKEAEEHHGPYESTAPKHHWSGFYAAYILARRGGDSAEQADAAARAYMDEQLTGTGTGA